MKISEAPHITSTSSPLAVFMLFAEVTKLLAVTTGAVTNT
jgi:hypothetical protein